MDKKTLKNLTIIITVAVGILGLLTSLFAILGLANVSNVDVGKLLKYITATGLLVIGLVFTSLGILKDRVKMLSSLYDIIFGSVFLGIGIFLLVDQEEFVFHSIVSVLIPLIIACFGVSLIIMAIISIIKKEKTSKILFPLILGTITIVIGIVFVVLSLKGNKDITKVIWLFIGLSMFIFMIIKLVIISKQNKLSDNGENKSSDNSENKSSDNSEITNI